MPLLQATRQSELSSPVIDIEALANTMCESSIGVLGGAFQTDQTQVRDVTAVLIEMALRFHFDAESLYRHWDREVFSEVSVELGDFTNAHAAASEFDWECLEAKVGATLLFESSTSALKYLTAIANNPRSAGKAMHGVVAALSGDVAGAVRLFEKARAEGAVLRGIPLLFCALSALQSMSADDAKVLLSDLQNDMQTNDISDRFVDVVKLLLEYLSVKGGEIKATELAKRYDLSDTKNDCPWSTIIRAAVLYWLGETPSIQLLGRLQRSIDQASLAGVHWYATQANGILRRCGKQRDTVRSETSDASESTWLADLLTRSVDWQAQLEKIDKLCSKHGTKQSATVAQDTRVVWFIYASTMGIELQARQQKKNELGVWSKGRKLDVLSNHEQLVILCESDRQLCSALERFVSIDALDNKDHKVDVIELNLLHALISHPRLYRAQKNDVNPPIPCTVVLTEPHLEVLQNKSDDSAIVRMSPYPSGASQHSAQWQINWIKPDRLQVATYKRGLIDVAHALTEAGLQVPKDGLSQLRKTMPVLSSMLTTYSDTELPGTRSLINKEADNTLHFSLTQTEEGLHIGLSLSPLGEHGPTVIPGVASQPDVADTHETLLANIDDAMYKLSRDLQAEQNIANEVLTHLPMPQSIGQFVWRTQNPSQGFEFISALQKLIEQRLRGDVKVHWVSAQAIEVSNSIDTSCMHIEIGGSFDWIHVDGELQAGLKRPLDISVLLGLLHEDNGCYVQVDETTVLELTEELHSKLCSLHGIYNAGRVHPLATAVLQDVVSGMMVTGDNQWQERLQRLNEAETLDPAVPAELTATLRDYQLHGFQWMVRLAHWGAGACLADDMGLGKTFQAIAVVLHRAGGGPTVVAAPTSVCANWITECKRFAPSLNVRRLVDRNREEMLGKRNRIYFRDTLVYHSC